MTRKDKELFYALVHSQVATTHCAGPIWSQEPGTLCRFLLWARGTQTLVSSPAALPGTLAASWIGSWTARTWTVSLIEDSVSSHIDHCSTKLAPNIRSYMSGLFSSCGYSTFGSSLLGWWTLVIGPFLLSVVDKAAVHMPRTAGAGPYDVPVVSLWGRQQVLVCGAVLEHHCILPTALQVQIATHPHQHLLFSYYYWNYYDYNHLNMQIEASPSFYLVTSPSGLQHGVSSPTVTGRQCVLGEVSPQLFFLRSM